MVLSYIRKTFILNFFDAAPLNFFHCQIKAICIKLNSNNSTLSHALRGLKSGLNNIFYICTEYPIRTNNPIRWIRTKRRSLKR